ncbi:MAG: serine/threonine protein kinase [Anaerolineae bacterium]|nr:serine/threonine protein kinase [Anaerolineae bacterium]
MSDQNSEFKQWLELPSNVSPFLPDFIQVTTLLEVGGQGVVYRGLAKGEDAAIKIYFPGQTDKRIEREITALGELNCANIVKLLWSDRLNIQDNELYVVATSYVAGTPLNHLIRQQELADHELAVIAYDVSRAIEAMWSRRTVHRDLKPSNIVIRADGRACVIDLGLARHLNDSSLTQMGATWGTRGYLSPEQNKGVRQLSCKSDIFALGVVLVECAMRRHPSGQDQQRLEALGLHNQLTHPLDSWQYAHLVKDMLHPRQTKRPLPSDILSTLSRYAP